MIVYVNGVLQPQPCSWTAFVGYGDTAGHFVIIDHRGMVVLND